MPKQNNWEHIGNCGVDSGQLLVCDPCYVHSEWEDAEYGTKSPPPFSYPACCEATAGDSCAGQLNYKLGHPGVGVVFLSGDGDGYYPVYARRNKEGRIVEVRIKME